MLMHEIISLPLNAVASFMIFFFLLSTSFTQYNYQLFRRIWRWIKILGYSMLERTFYARERKKCFKKKTSLQSNEAVKNSFSDYTFSIFCVWMNFIKVRNVIFMFVQTVISTEAIVAFDKMVATDRKKFNIWCWTMENRIQNSNNNKSYSIFVSWTILPKPVQPDKLIEDFSVKPYIMKIHKATSTLIYNNINSIWGGERKKTFFKTSGVIAMSRMLIKLASSRWHGLSWNCVCMFFFSFVISSCVSRPFH